MGKLKTFEVVFEGDNVDVFRSGETIHGFIKIVLSAPKDKIRAIKIKFKGKAHTSWTEGSGDDKETYSASETYFKEKLTCFGKGDNDKQQLDAGEHRFPFSFKIPDVPLPFPFESYVGWIRYKVKCKIDRVRTFDHTTERLFTVTGYPIDLRTIPSAMHPVHEEDSKTVCCLCCETGPIIVKASTDKGGYVPGESIFVSGTVENNSNRNILSLNVRLKQMVKYYSSGGHTTKRDFNIIKEKAPGCGESGVARMDWKPHLIPPIPPTGPQGCNIIKIEYMVHFEGDVENTPFDAEVFLPITIGTVPVYRPVYPDPSNVVVHQPAGGASAPPPPTYEVAVEGVQEIPSKSGYDYTFGKLMYAPYYPTYNLPAQVPSWDPAHPPPVVDPTYPPGGYPPPGEPSYPPPSGEGYPPPAGAVGYPPPAGAVGYPPPAGAVGYPPPAGAVGYPPPAGAVGDPPPAGMEVPAGGEGYPPPSALPADGGGYPPPAGAAGYPPTAGDPPLPASSPDQTAPAGEGGSPPSDDPGNPPVDGIELNEI